MIRIRTAMRASVWLTLLGLMYAAPVSADDAPDPIGLWRFEKIEASHVIDSSGHDHDGVCRGAPQLTAGVAGNAIVLGGGSYVLVPTDANLHLTQATITAWVYLDALGGGIGFNRGASWEDNRFMLHTALGSGPDGRLWFTHSDGEQAIKTPGPAMPIKQWTHVAVTCDGHEKRIYINGDLALSIAQEVPLVVDGAPFSIGRAQGLTPADTAGAVDEVALYDTALSAEQIAADFHRFVPPKLGATQTLTSPNDYSQSLRIDAISIEAPMSATLVAVQAEDNAQAVQLDGEGKTPGSDLITVRFPPAANPGRYTLTARVAVRDMRDFGRGWRIEVSGGDDVIGWHVVHGYDYKQVDGFRDGVIPFQLNATDIPLQVRMFWVEQDDSKPKVQLRDLTLARVGDLPPVSIVKVWPDHIRYREDQDGKVTVTCRNNTQRSLNVTLHVDLAHDLGPTRRISNQRVTLDAGVTSDYEVPLVHGGGRFGYEVTATALMDGNVIDTGREFFCVADNPYLVTTHHYRFSDGMVDRRNWRKEAVSLNSILGAQIGGQWAQLKHDTIWSVRNWVDLNATESDLADTALEARQAYVTMWERYSWSPGGCIDMTPQVPVWLDGDNGRYIYSHDHNVRLVRSLKHQGIGVITYILPFGQGLEAIDMARRNPQWFCIDNDLLDFTSYNVADLIKVREFRHRLEKAPPEQWPIFQQQSQALPGVGYIQVNFTNDEVFEHVIDEVRRSTQTYDWDGVRWDVGHMNTGHAWGRWRPFVDFYGKPVCDSPEQMVEQTVSNLSRFKAALRETWPNFAFGTNYGGENPLLYPAMTQELMRDGGWLLDEETRRWSWPDSKYRFWDKYYQYVSDRGELMTSLGGHYNPYGPTPLKALPFPVMRMYTMIFGLAGHGHPEMYTRSNVFPVGDAAQLAVRYGALLFDPELRRVEDPAAVIDVTPESIWWDRSVLKRTLSDGRQRWVIHLINPPVGEQMEDNVDNALPDPVRDVSLTLRLPRGATNTRAWAICCESWQTGDVPRTQAHALDARRDGDTLTVTLPELLFWKTIVIELD